MIRFRPTYANVTSSLALFLALGGSAWAVAHAGSSPKIHACVTSHGAVKIVSGTHCAQGQHLLTWNVKGPPGQRGPRGFQGQPGQQGTAGTLSAFEAYRTTADAVDLTTASTPVATLSGLPAGAYVLTGNVTLDGHTDTQAAGQVTCTLTAGSDSDSSYVYLVGGTTAFSLPLTVTHTFATAGSASIDCQKQLDHSAFVENAELVAVQVAHQTRTHVTH